MKSFYQSPESDDARTNPLHSAPSTAAVLTTQDGRIIPEDDSTDMPDRNCREFG